ncbi:MAG: hypothetical protein MZU97_24510 [Bacillus subtilis]|nr:hypothetical protein [Bacillus subtilis]
MTNRKTSLRESVGSTCWPASHAYGIGRRRLQGPHPRLQRPMTPLARSTTTAMLMSTGAESLHRHTTRSSSTCKMARVNAQRSRFPRRRSTIVFTETSLRSTTRPGSAPTGPLPNYGSWDGSVNALALLARIRAAVSRHRPAMRPRRRRQADHSVKKKSGRRQLRVCKSMIPHRHRAR